MLLKINPYNPQERQIRRVVDIIRNGGIVAYPTDTFYGIGCDIMNKKAIEKIYLLKQRNKSKPFSFICPDLKDISTYAKVSTSATHPDGTVFENPSLLHDHFIKTIDAVIDGGPVPGIPSSVISLIDDIPEIIRHGAGDVDIFE